MADDKKPDDKKSERKEGENLAPTPTQAENDAAKIKVMGGDPKAAKPRDAKADEPPEQLPPTPTQAENDAAKKAAMNEDDEATPVAKTDKRAAEADKPGGYTTRGKG